MRKIYLSLISLFFVATAGFAQLSGTKNIPGDYATLAAAITDLNAVGVGAGGVTLNLLAGNPETAPAGTGYYITATGTLANPITITGNGNTITAGINTVAGSMDAIFKIVGGDYITIQGFSMVENAGNTVTATGATNTMTEAGVLIIHASATDGAQNNTIQNNTITLSSAYANAVGILSTSSSTTSNASPGANTALDATTTAGTNSNTKVYSNTISNVAFGLLFICPPITATIFETGIDIGGSSLGTANNITFGNNTASTGPWNRASLTSSGIQMRNAAGNSIRFNTINTAASLTVAMIGINVSSGTTPAGVTYTSTISDNTVSLTNTGTTAITGIDFGHGISTGTIVGSNNTITINQNSSAANSAAIIGIKASYASATNSANGNTITVNQSNSAAATTSAVTGITCAGVGTTINVNNNPNITINQSVSGAGSFGSGAITYIDVNSTSATINVTGNNLNTSGSTIRSTGSLICVNQNSTSTVLDNFKNNTVNIDRVAASGTVFFTSSTNLPSMVADTVSNNSITFTNLSGTTSVTAISVLGGNTSLGVKSICNNIINISGTHTGTSKGIAWGYAIGTAGGQVNGNTITINCASPTVVGIDGTGTNAAANSISGNTLSLTSSTISPTSLIGINGAATGPYQINNNTFSALNFTGIITGSPVISGIALSVGTGNNINNNVINNISVGAATSAASPVLDGILISGGVSANVFKNKIYGITTASTGVSTIVNGIRISGGGTTANNVYNNLVGGLSASAATNTDAIRGISITSTTATSTNNLYYNTVYISGSGGTNFGSSGLYHAASATATTATLNLRNNIIVNATTPNGTGLAVAYRRSTGTAGTLANYAATSNNNLLYAGTPGASNLIYSDGTGSAQTLPLYISGAFTAGTIAPRDAQSLTENPPFLSTTGSNANYLHIDPAIATQVESGAAVIATYTDDYDGNTRSVTLPDIGADEGNFILADFSAPLISYTPLTNACAAGARTLTATISDASGVPQTGAGLPVAYFKINAGAYTAATGTWVSGNTYTFSIGAGSVIGDVISYYIVAQDNAGTPNVGVFPSAGAAGLTANPPAAATPPTTPSTYSVLAVLSGTYNVGVGQPYTTLTAAVNDYNTKCISGAVVFNLMDATYPSETYPISILTNPASSAINTLTIRPDASIAAPILFTSAVATTATIDLNGASYVTIDGRNGGSGTNKFIIIENTSTTSAAAGNAILLRNEASNNTLTYLDVRSANQNAPANSAITTNGSIPGAIAIGSTSGTNGNDNNTISNCNIHSTATALLGTCIYMGNATTAGTAANNDNNTVSGNNLYDFFIAATASAALDIAPGNNNWTISGNSVFQTATRTYTSTQTVRAFWITPNLGSVAGATGTISGNFIGGSAASCGGTAMTMTGTSAWLFQGMDISTGNIGTTSIQGNTINNINMTTASTSTTALLGIGTANGTVNIGNVTGNTFGNPAVNSAPYGITFTTTGTLGGITALRVGGGSTGPHIVSNNNIGGIELIGNATTVAPSFGGIVYAVATTGTISNNTIGSSTLSNSINLSSTSATSTSISLTRGISVTTGSNTTISNNLIANINSNYSGTGSGNTVTGIQVGSGAATVSGNTIRNLYSASQSTGGGTTSGIIGISYSSTTAPAVISGNAIFALKNTNATTTAAIANQAIAYGGPTTGNNLIEKNNIHSIALASPTNSAATLSGMDIGSGVLTIQNNMIRLGIDSNGTSIVSPCLVRGITKNTATTKVFHNSIYIGGTGVGTTATNTFAFVRTATASIDSVMDNIFVNNRSNATTGGKHYQVNLNATATLVLNNNVYFGTGTGNVFGFNGTTDVASYSNGWVATDLNSYSGDPIFINATGNASTGDLHINPAIASVTEGLGFALSAVTDDYDGQTRSGLTPVDIGADAGNFIPVAFMSFSSSTTTQANTSNVSTNTTNQQVIGIEVVTTGLVNPLSATSFTLSTNGTTNTANIANAKLFYTGNSSTFATTTQVGSTVAAPSGTFNITGSQTLTSGTNYFWLTYDVICGATPGNAIDAECSSITIGSAQIPTVQNPGAGRIIVAGPLTGTKTIGGGGSPDYATLSAAMTAINTLGLGGNLTLNIMGNLSEPGQVVIPKWAECGGSGFTLTIKPNTTAVVTGSVSSGALIKINGAGNIIIDGSNSGGTDRSLTLQNTTTTTSGNAVVWLASPAVANGSSNNIIKNCIIEGNAATTTFTGIHVGGSTAIGLTTGGLELNSNNTFNNNLFRKTQYGMTLFGFGAATPDINNVISNNNFGTTVTGEGFSLLAINADRQQGLIVSGNEVQNVTNSTNTSSTPFGGIRLLDFKNGLCYNNKIHDLAYTGTSTPKIYGIAVTSSTYTTAGNPSNAQVYNNIVYKINSTGTSATWNTTGILASAGYGDKYYYNSVHLTGQLANSSSGLAAAFANGDGNITSVCTNIDVRNNIFSLTGSSATAGGNFWAHYTAATTLAGSTLNYNDLYCNGTGATNNVGRFNAVSYATLGAWQTATSQDANSIAADPSFNGISNLVPQIGSPLLGGGTPISVTTDILGTIRSGTTPSIGAYEIGGDFGAPLITYTALGGICSTGDRLLTATITDASGVPTAGVLQPRIYYKKGILGNFFSQQGSLTSGSGTNGTWTFNILSADMGGLATNDTVYYYVIAQDIVGTPNISSNPSGVIAIDVNSITSAPTPNFYRIQTTLSGNYNVGASQPYTTLTAAVSAYNNSCISGPVTFLLTDAVYNEVGQMVIQSNSYASAVNTLTIRPANGVVTTVSGSVASGALLKINGASYVKIDGSNSGGTDRSLTIINTNTTSPTAISLASLGTGLGAANDTIKNCNISTGISSATGYGIAVGGATPGSSGADNDNVTLQNNNITVATIGIYATGTAAVSAGGDDNLSITGNTIDYNGTVASIGIQVGNALNSSISQNNISEQSTATFSPTGISLETGFVSSTVSRNTVSKAITSNTGGYGGRGITIGTGTATSNLTIANNVIYGVNGTNWTGFGNSSSMGIGIGMIGNSSTITTTAGGINLYYNSVNMYSTFSSTSACITAALYVGSGASALDIRNNIFVNTLNNTGTGTTSKAYAIYSAAANTAFTNINYNLYDTAATQGVLGFLTSNQGDIAAWRTATAQDVNSLSADPLFNSNIILAPQAGSPALGAGTPVTVLTDYLGTVRSVLNPSIGAYETAGEFTPPVITYTALGGICATGNRQLTATITDASGVPTSGILQPRIYYKKGLLGSYYSQQGSLTTGTGTNGTWTFNIVSADMGGLVTGDTVYYYVIAQDIAGTPNIGSNPAGVVATSVNAVTTAPTPNFYKIQTTLSGPYNVGAGQTFTTLTAAVNAYNNSCLTGPIEFILTDASYAEAGQMIINNPAYASTVNTLYIHPTSELRVNVSAAVSNGPVLKVLSNYVTINGTSSGLNGNSLTITNTSLTSPNVVLIGSTGTTPITNVTIQNSNLVNGVNTASAVVVSDGTAIGTAGYFNNITLVGDSVQKAYAGIYAIAVVQAGNGSGLRIDSNLLNKSGANAISFTGIYVQGVDGATINGNYMANFDGTGSQDDKGIWLATGTVNTTVTQNSITNLNYTGTSGYGGHGVYVTTGNAAAGIKVTNNMIAGLSGDGWSYTSIPTDNTIGIAISGTQGGIEVYNNSINLFGNTLNQSSAMSMGIYLGAGSNANIRNNIIVNNLGLLGATGYGTTGIYAVTANTQFTAINYNDYIVAATGSGVNYIGQIAAAGSLTLAAWQTASGGDANSLNIVPVFVSPTDLHLVAASNCTLHRKGTPISGLTKDFDNDTRNATYPDMGADEYTGNIATTFTWTGAINTDWFNPGNWNNCNDIPGTTSNVVINGSLTNYPLVTGNVIIKSLTLNAGATVTVATGYDIKLLGP